MASPPIDSALTLALEHQTRSLLSELDKRLSAMDVKWESRVGELESQVSASSRRLDSVTTDLRADVEIQFSSAADHLHQIEADVKTRVAALQSTMHVFELWRPRVEASVESLHSSVDSIRAEVSKMGIRWSTDARVDGSGQPGLLGAHGSGSGRVPAPEEPPDRPRFGSCFENYYRDSGHVHPGADAHYPVTGMWSSPHSPSFSFNAHCGHSQGDWGQRGPLSRHCGGLPKLNFPTFDGTYPKLWQKRCEDYFEMYATETFVWVKVSTMHFVGAAARWLQSIEPRLPSMSWRQFCQAIHDRFGREQHELVIRKLFHIKQTSTVQDYVDRFSELVDLLVTYEHTTDPLYYTMKFIDGLRDDIKSVILVQRPGDLDTACSLALLQEAGDSSRRPDPVHGDSSYAGRSSWKSAVPQSARWDPSRGLAPESSKTPTQPAPTIDSKVASLRSYRRASGLCQYCAEKWNKGHKCSPTVQLHAVQEMWELFDHDQSDTDPDFQDSSDQFAVMLSQAAISTPAKAQAFRLQGCLQGVELLMLLDSGSSHCFLNTNSVAAITGLTLVSTPLMVTVANGEVLTCTSELVEADWTLQGVPFRTTFKLLSLPHYDAILGMDWLQQFSPMLIDWKNKWLSIPFQDQLIVLRDCQSLVPAGSLLEIRSVSSTSTPQHLFSATTSAVPEPVRSLLQQFDALFQPPTTLPPSRACDHSIPLVDGARPVNIRPYRLSPALKDEVESQVAEMLQNGIIQNSSSAFSSPVLMVKKKDNSWRFCVDYRHLNALTVKSKYPVPIIDELLDELAGACWFSILDLRAGFHQILLKPGEEYKTAFQTHTGHYEFRVMAFGLTGAPGTFQKAMNHTLAPLLRKCTIVFFDDILVYSRSLQDHFTHLQQVFELLSSDHWKIKMSKCSFAQPQVTYLGHIISSAGVATDPAKIQAIVAWPVPKCVKELRSFLGLSGYYRKFIRHYGVICQPLTALLKKGALYVWTADHDTAFCTLKQAMSSAPVLALPDFNVIFQIETDASANGVGAVLSQQGHPLAFLSKALGVKSRGLSTYEKEYLAVQQWRAYLQHQKFVIITDHKSLSQLNEQRLHTPWQHKVFTKLLGLQYRVQYRPGTENRAADALSRYGPAEINAVSVVIPQWLTDIQQTYDSDSKTKELVAKLAIDPAAVAHFSLKDGLIRYKNRLWIGEDPHLQAKIVSALHSSPIGGHSGVPVTYSRVKSIFAWKNMKSFVRSFVQQCQICLQAKPDRAAYPGKLQPLPVPPSAWHTISMDFVEGLPRSGSWDCILVVVDKFSKFGHFVPLSHPYTAHSVAQLFLSHIYRLHGFPAAIVSDRDPIFTSAFWRQLFQLAGTELRLSSSYHPQSDGQTERLNQCLETFLRCFVSACPKKWSSWLPAAEYWYNTSLHSALGCSPFEVLYGRKPRSLGLSFDAAAPVALSAWLQERSVMQNLIHQHLIRAQTRMKKQADKHRSERSFSVGDWVYMKLQPYVQSSVLPRAHQKLSYKFFGPYRVANRVGSVAYRLELPNSSRIHPVVHVSQLKLAKGFSGSATSSLPDELPEFSIPLRILQTRGFAKGKRFVKQVLVQWSNLPTELATWEDQDNLRQCYPFAPAWGQAGFQGGENVNNESMDSPTVSRGVPNGEPEAAPVVRTRRVCRANVRQQGPEWVQ
jgi:hypothetical protein